MEDVLTLEELYLLRDRMLEAQWQEFKRAASLQGHDLDGEFDNSPTPSSSFDEVQRKAAAKLAGKSEEEYVFDLVGVEVDADDD